MAERFVRWILVRLRPVRGWLLLALAALAALVLPLSLAAWMHDLDGLWWVSSLAVVAGAWLASRRWPRALVLLAALAIGGLVTVQWASPFLPGMGQVWAELGATLRWLTAGMPAASLPWFDVLRTSAWQLTGTLHDVVVQGDRELLLRLVAVLMVGATAFWLSWWLFRGPGIRPWLAAMPAGVLVALTAFFVAGQEYYVLFFFLVMLALAGWARWYQLQRAWEDHGSDAPSDLGMDHTAAVAIAGAAAVVLILVVPQVVVQPAVNWFWDLAREPWARVQGQVETLFPGVLRGPGGPWATGALRQNLPRQHLLGSGPELQDIEMFRVVIDYSQANFAPYWRELTYAMYTGRGWQIEDELEDIAVPAGRSWSRDVTAAGEGGRGLAVEQRVALAQGTARVVVATGMPVAANADYRAMLRGSDDLVALVLRDPARRYVVRSQIPMPSAQQLRIVNYYPAIKENPYLTITNNLPMRVKELATHITSDAVGPYEKARRLEAYLRTLPYDLDVPLIEDDRDLVDAFLFDIRRGYCDYFASAFVVMARTLGLPARLATGYAAGTQTAPGEWRVTAADAHSWPEVYFEGIGWLPFEPTPSQPPSSVPTPPSGAAAGDGFRLPVIGDGVPGSLAVFMVGLLAAGGLVWFVRAWRTPQGASETYARIAAWGARVGRSPYPGETMRSFTTALTGRLASISGDGRAGQVSQLVQAIAAWCEAALYAPKAERPASSEQRRLWRHWQRAGGARLWLWVRQRITVWRAR